MAIGYHELAAQLREAILDGTYPAGTVLPKQDKLASDHGCNVKTVRRAVQELEAEGLVTAVRRKGTVVRNRPPMRRLGIERYAKSKWKSGLVAFGADREASGRQWKPGDQTNTVRRITASDQIAEALGLEVGSEVVERARLVKEDGVPTHTLTSYYRPEDVDGTLLADPSAGPAGRGGGFGVLTMQGLEPDHMSETIHARMPTPEEIQELQLPPGEPVMILERRTYTSEHRPVEFALGVHAASRFSWTYEFNMPE